MSSSGSMLPPESTTTTGGSNARGSSSSAATPAAPAGSTTSFARSRQSSRARDSDSSETVTTSSTRSRTSANGTSPGRPTAMPSAIVVIRSQRHRVPGGERGRERRGALGLHADHPDVGLGGLHGRARSRRAGRRRRCRRRWCGRRALLEDLQPDRALPGDDVGVVEGVDEHRAGLGREGLRARAAPRRPTSRANRTSAPYALVAATLGSGAPSGMKTVDVQPEQRRGQRHALRVVAGAGRDDAAARSSVGEPGDPDVRAADLERAGALEVLALEPDRVRRPRSDSGREPCTGVSRMTPSSSVAGGLDVVHRHRQVLRRRRHGRQCARGAPVVRSAVPVPVHVATEHQSGRSDESRARPEPRRDDRHPRANASPACRSVRRRAAARRAGRHALDRPPPTHDHPRRRALHHGGDRDAERPAAPVERASGPTGSPARASSAIARAVCSPDGRQPCCTAQAARAGPRAIASRQPRPPHVQAGPSGSTTTWPTWPALPVAPSTRRPPRTSPPPTPVGHHHRQRVVVPACRPLPVLAAASATASLCSRTGRPGNRSDSRARNGKPRQPGMFNGDTSPAGHAIGPPQPTPTAAGWSPARTSSATPSSAAKTSSPTAAGGVGTCPDRSTEPSAATTAAASFVPPTSRARTGASCAGAVRAGPGTRAPTR